MRAHRPSRRPETASAARSSRFRACAATAVRRPASLSLSLSLYFSLSRPTPRSRRRSTHSKSLTPFSFAPSPHVPPGKYRAHNGIEGSAINDWLSTCLLFAPLMPLFTILSTHQLLNDYEIKNNGKFGFFGKFTPGTAAVAPSGGSPASAEMTV